MQLTYAIGDIHGCLDKLASLVKQCQLDAGALAAKFVFLGDYIDRGPDSRGVVEFLIQLQSQKPTQIICLAGNHEDLALAALSGEFTKIIGSATAAVRLFAAMALPQPRTFRRNISPGLIHSPRFMTMACAFSSMPA